MSIGSLVRTGLVARVALLMAACLLASSPMPAWAQFCNGFRGNNVGGISIDSNGVVGQPPVEGRRDLLESLRATVKRPAGDLQQPVEMRLVALRGLEAAVAHAMKDNHGQMPDEVRFLAGLQRIQYVFIYPEENDIVLAGPGEGWKVRDDATVVGVTTDRHGSLLDDLIVALQTSTAAREKGISCSIDPTAEGRRNLDARSAPPSWSSSSKPKRLARSP